MECGPSAQQARASEDHLTLPPAAGGIPTLAYTWITMITIDMGVDYIVDYCSQ